MTWAHATQKGAVGLNLGDEKSSKEMIDAPMLKQVTTSEYMHSFSRLNILGLGREDYPNSARCWPTHSNTSMTTSTMGLSSHNHVDAHQRRISHRWLEVIVKFRALNRLCGPSC